MNHNTHFNDRDLVETGLSAAMLEMLLAHHVGATLPRLQRFWDYYRNPRTAEVSSGVGGTDGSGSGSAGIGSDAGTSGRLNLAQARGLPARLNASREIVIENDIAWRIHTLVDFMFAKGVIIQSMSDDDAQGARIEALLREVFDANGGTAFFQDLALLGSIYGYVDVLVRLEPTGIRLDLVDPPRALPVLDPDDYRRIDTYILHYVGANRAGEDPQPRWRDLLKLNPAAWSLGSQLSKPSQPRRITEIISSGHIARFEDRQLVEEHINRLGQVPVVHFQNLPQPFFYEGLSDVEPLIPLQDELNTRLSDRANRVTFQSFKMYLGKGIERFVDRPVGPGQMWQTDNPEASIQEFGGDAASPSEDAHIEQIRDAMDKTSGVNGIAAGMLRDKVGNLTSENALRMVLMGLLAKTEKRRLTYGAGIARLCELILHAADVTGQLASRPADRRIRLDWPSPLPENMGERLDEAQQKLKLGVPRQQVLAELGYAGDL